ncbi:PREDICTED: vacuolar protein sorting-associated protein 72 homolog [Nicrophorus vespilloides]|uniref:Vacuolar protein sorting-associated protein 72 homolog n=1 Tax=Nicrophorus vespilloides TaxID=110193 RepID=A0ABM1MFV1_NICVS|nr:PREDICTED: vacuolar protein sorting-associated protein 72 homolog [Nicrophorus vespilloides]
MNRERRNNAGNRMSKLLDEEEECKDDFYKTNYGGFEETETDNEYEAEGDDEDIVDSDFSIDENDEPISDNEDAEGQKKKRRVVTGSYKEPVQKQDKQKPKVKPPRPKVSTPRPPRKDHSLSIEISERKSIRKSTAAKTAATAQRIKVRNLEQKRRPKRAREEEWIPTQEELLEEAKITEEENIQSLEKYQKLENEKKTKKISKKTYNGPIIKYQSLRMPLIEELDDVKEKEVDETKDGEEKKYYERTLISFLNDPNDEVFDKFMKKRVKLRPAPKVKCTITNMPAKYIDPLTCLPYHNSRCFKLIRETYYQQMETHGDKSNAKVNEWLKWYAKNKDSVKLSALVRSSMLKNIKKVI